jgi:hypothetical protein
MALAVVEVEPWVLPAGAGTEVDGVPTDAVDAGVVAADNASRWGRNYHSLPLLCFLVGADRIVRDYDITDKLWE